MQNQGVTPIFPFYFLRPVESFLEMNETKYGKQKRKQKNPQKTPNPRSKGKTVPKATSTDR